MDSREEAERFGSWSVQLRHSRLQRSGIGSLLVQGGKRDGQEVYRRRYAVHASGLQAIEIASVEGANRNLRTPIALSRDRASSPSLLRQLEKMAVRSLYTLGLSAGEVILVSAGGERRYAVEEVTPSAWIGSRRLRSLYERAQKEQERRQAEGLEGGLPLMLGMDPEFLIVDPARSGEVVPASRFLDKEGEVGCDAVHGEGGISYPIAELRPEPSESPRGLLIGLMRTLRMAGEMIGDRSLHWLAGGMPKSGLPLGGHLHFSGIALTAELLRALDNYLTLPVSVLEAPSSQKRRPKYGYLGDFRRQPHGGFEYRTLPSFLVSPMLTKGIVYTAHLIATNHAELTRRPLDEEERLHRAYYAGQRDVIREYLEPLLADLESLAEQKEAQKHILPLLNRIRQGGTWNESRDIRPLWNIPFRP